ncbi:hypothetical protein M404DRAFT_164855 [Pisolithus tinctorius Marx 270]|uniref:Uncharacterized protein n=1 Tax=Pisolithus tinctorius Marx 270 TaxID=870435 RepID=A0A0C3IFU0_PISTI|nr:hypothetical protein M404DRAFT_164855 [Pisolithus tinctorius Marx 270]
MELAVTLAGTSSFLSNPPSIAHAHPALHDLQYSRQAGELTDVFVFMVPSASDPAVKQEVIHALQDLEGVVRVDELVARRRAKRDEF